jgi:hypothetical protein
MVNVHGRETGLREPRRAYGGVVNNVSSVASCDRLRRSNQAYFLATKTSKEGDWRIVDGKTKESAGGQFEGRNVYEIIDNPSLVALRRG